MHAGAGAGSLAERAAEAFRQYRSGDPEAMSLLVDETAALPAYDWCRGRFERDGTPSEKHYAMLDRAHASLRTGKPSNLRMSRTPAAPARAH